MGENEYDNGRIDIWKAISLVFALVLSISSTILGWLCVRAIDSEIRIIKLEEREKALEHTIREIPPNWFKEMVYENRRRIESVEKEQDND